METEFFNKQIEHEYDYDVEALWEQGNEAVQKIIKDGAQKYIASLELPETSGGRRCACIDERVPGDKVAIPGSGILETEAHAFEHLKMAGITSMSSHEDCGAAMAAYEKLSDMDRDNYENADHFAQEWTKRMAERLGVPYTGHIKVETPGQHVARAIYYDGSGIFRADAEGLPKGFTISRAFQTTPDAQATLKFSINIANGHHGFEGRFDKQNPLLIIPIGHAKQLRGMRAEIKDVLEKMENAPAIHLDSGFNIDAKKIKQAA